VCDQPFVTGAIIAKLNERWAITGKTIVASRYSNTLGVPALFDRSCFAELLAVDQEQGAKPIILRNPARLAELAFPEGANDIDTISDYQAAQSTAVSQPLKYEHWLAVEPTPKPLLLFSAEKFSD
jgi:molybdenum cofactor cytidylyltransferase